MARALGLTGVDRAEGRLSIGCRKSADCPADVIPDLQTDGAEHMLAALVTAKRKQLFSQIVVDLMGGDSDRGALTQTIRAAGDQFISLAAIQRSIFPSFCSALLV